MTALDTATPAGVRLLHILTTRNAQSYIDLPWRLDKLFPDVASVSMRDPDFIVALVEHELERIYPTYPIHLRGAMLYARWRRRYGERLMREVA